MTPETMIALTMIMPAAVAVLLPAFDARPNIREGVTLLGAVLLFAVVLQLLPEVSRRIPSGT